MVIDVFLAFPAFLACCAIAVSQQRPPESGVLRESGRLKASYNISLADSIAIGEANEREAELVTADHHEFDSLEEKREAKFYWSR